MEDRLRAALVSRDGERLLRLCQELGRNPSLCVGFYEASLTHHIALSALGMQGLECMKVLINQFGTSCLKMRDKNDNTVLHVAAQNQDESWMKLIWSALGQKGFEDRGQHQRTCAHFAAINTSSSSALKWLVTQLGPNCLLVKDAHNNTALHLAAWMLSPDTLKFIFDTASPRCSHLIERIGERGRTVQHMAAMNERGSANFLWLLAKCRSDHLLLKDNDGNMPLHVAALHQSSDCMQAIMDKIGFRTEFFKVPGQDGQTAAHFAAMNPMSNSALNWLVQTLEPSCLKVGDNNGATPAHLAAKHQGVDSLRLIKDRLGVSGFNLKDAKGQTVVDYAAVNSGCDKVLVLNWIVEQQLLHQQSQQPPNVLSFVTMQPPPLTPTAPHSEETVEKLVPTGPPPPEYSTIKHSHPDQQQIATPPTPGTPGHNHLPQLLGEAEG